MVKTYRLILVHGRFWRFWLALLLVMLADEIVRTTLVWQVYAATGSTQAVGVLKMALRLEKALGGSAELWVRMQLNHDLAVVRERSPAIAVTRLHAKIA